MSFLFDSSAIVNIVRRRRARYLAGYTLDLAFYEIVNAIWKEAFLVKSLPEGVAVEFMRQAIAAWRILPKVPVDEVETFKKAKEHMISAYDAAYLAAALSRGLILVTDDSKLRTIAGGISSREYLRAREDGEGVGPAP